MKKVIIFYLVLFSFTIFLSKTFAETWPFNSSSSSISSPFGARYLNGGYDWHKGIDLPASIGTEVRAVKSGWVDWINTSGQNTSVIILNDDYSYIRYTHITPDPALVQEFNDNGYYEVNEDITPIGTVLDYTSGGDHLDLKYYLNNWNDETDAINPLNFLPYTNPTNGNDIELFTYVESDADGLYINIKCTTTESALDFNRVDLNLIGVSNDGQVIFNTDDILRGDGYDSGVDFNDRTNCGEEYLDGEVDNFENELSIKIEVQNFDGTADQELNFKFYLIESVYNQLETLSASATLTDVKNEWYFSDNVDFPTCIECNPPAEAPNAPTLTSIEYIQEKGSIRLDWEPASEGEFGLIMDLW